MSVVWSAIGQLVGVLSELGLQPKLDVFVMQICVLVLGLGFHLHQWSISEYHRNWRSVDVQWQSAAQCTHISCTVCAHWPCQDCIQTVFVFLWSRNSTLISVDLELLTVTEPRLLKLSPISRISRPLLTDIHSSTVLLKGLPAVFPNFNSCVTYKPVFSVWFVIKALIPLLFAARQRNLWQEQPSNMIAYKHMKW